MTVKLFRVRMVEGFDRQAPELLTPRFQHWESSDPGHMFDLAGKYVLSRSRVVVTICDTGNALWCVLVRNDPQITKSPNTHDPE